QRREQLPLTLQPLGRDRARLAVHGRVDLVAPRRGVLVGCRKVGQDRRGHGGVLDGDSGVEGVLEQQRTEQVSLPYPTFATPPKASKHSASNASVVSCCSSAANRTN